MAGIGDVLRHLVRHAPGLSEENRQEFLSAVDEAHPEPEPEPEREPEPVPGFGAPVPG